MKDMTAGSPGKVIFHFAISLMLGNIFQQMYTFVDTMIVGRYLGTGALAALGAVEWLIFIMFGCTQGMTHGFSICIAHRFGSRAVYELKKDITHSFYLCLCLTALLTASGLWLGIPVLRLLKTPKEIMEPAFSYLRILFAGSFASVIYNFLAGILRAAGDGRAPLWAVTIGSLCNIGLDLVFVILFQWGIEGAACATVISWLVSALYCLAALSKMELAKPDKESWRPEVSRLGRILCLGLPAGFQNVITGTGGVIVQSVVNGFGILFIAGFTAANRLYGLLETAAASYGYAMASYTGQNMGARLPGRIRKGLKEAALLGLGTACLMSFVMLFFGKRILGCFLAGKEQAAVAAGYEFLVVLSLFFPLLYLLYIVRSCVQGMGDTFFPMISSVIQLVMRMACALLLVGVMGYRGVFFGEAAAWIGADLLLLIVFRHRIRNLEESVGGIRSG
jgi:putative MATE family efflux protein